MILIDTSAWIEFLRDTRSDVCEAVDRLLEADICITDPVLTEVLAGARDERQVEQLRGLLGRAQMRRCGPADFEFAASLYRACRRQGQTVRRMIDCLIAAVAIREGTPLLQLDRDFEVLARHSELAIYDG